MRERWIKLRDAVELIRRSGLTVPPNDRLPAVLVDWCGSGLIRHRARRLTVDRELEDDIETSTVENGTVPEWAWTLIFGSGRGSVNVEAGTVRAGHRFGDHAENVQAFDLQIEANDLAGMLKNEPSESEALTRSRVYSVEGRLQWPADTADLVFLGRAVDRIGVAVFGDRWRPTAPIYDPNEEDGINRLAENALGIRAHRVKNLPALLLADQLLREDDPELPRCKDAPLMDSLESLGSDLAVKLHPSAHFNDREWDRAVAIAKRFVAEDVNNAFQFDVVFDKVKLAAAAGTLKTVVVQIGKGETLVVPEAAWVQPDARDRLDTCRVDIRQPFSDARPTPSHTGYLYVTADSLEIFIGDLTGAAVAKSGKGGRPRRPKPFNEADVPAFERMHPLVLKGDSPNKAAGIAAAEFFPSPGQIDAAQTRLRKAYRHWAEYMEKNSV